MSQSFIQVYNNVAADYNTTALVQRHIGEEFLTELDFITIKPKKILDLGCATGYFTHLLQQRYSQAEVIGIDGAEAMIAIAQHDYPDCQFLQQDILQAEFAPASIDMIFANCVWYCVDDLAIFLQRCQRWLSPQGLCMFSSYGPDTWRELEIVQPAFHLYDMHNIGDAVLDSGFADPVVTTKWLPVKFDSAEQCWLSLLYNGDAAMCFAQPEAIEVKGDQPLKVTYEVILGHAWKGEIKNKHFQEVTIPISSIQKRSKRNRP